MPIDENFIHDNTNGAIQELGKVAERTYGTEIIIRLDDLRASQLEPEALRHLQTALNDIATSAISEAKRIATGNRNNDAFGKITKGQLESGLLFVYESGCGGLPQNEKCKRLPRTWLRERLVRLSP